MNNCVERAPERQQAPKAGSESPCGVNNYNAALSTVVNADILALVLLVIATAVHLLKRGEAYDFAPTPNPSGGLEQ